MRAVLWILLVTLLAFLARVLLDNPPFSAHYSPLFLLGLGGCLLVGSLAAASLALHGRYGSTIRRAWLAILSSAITLVGADLVLNRFLDRHKYVRTAPDPVVHHRLEPGSRHEMRSPDFRAVLRVNEQGLRGPEVSTTKQDGTLRILMLGDSFTLGEGVAEEATFSRRLERLLSADGRRVEVLNAGVDSYAPILSYLDLRHRLMRFEPDIVILNLDMSDLLQEVYYRRFARVGKAGEILAVPPSRDRGNVVVRLEDWVLRNLYSLRLVYVRLHDSLGEEDSDTMEAILSRRNDRLLQHTLESDDVDRSPQWDRLFDSVRRIHDLCRKRGTRFVVSVYPWGHQVNDDEWPGRRFWIPDNAVPSESSRHRIRDFCNREAIPLADAFSAFRAHRGSARLYFDLDMHWTPAGHRVMAEVLADFLGSAAAFRTLSAEAFPDTPGAG